MEIGNGEAGAGRQRVERPGNSYGIPMEFLWSTYGVPMEQHASNTPATGCVLAGSAGAGRRGPGELAEWKRLPRLAGAVGFAGWAGRGKKEAAKAKVPARGFDWARDGISDSNFSDEPHFVGVGECQGALAGKMRMLLWT